MRRQLSEEILPDTSRAVGSFVRSAVTIRPKDIADALVERLDDITSSGKLPPPPLPSDVIKTIAEESKNLFLTTPELETPDYKVHALFDTRGDS